MRTIRLEPWLAWLMLGALSSCWANPPATPQPSAQRGFVPRLETPPSTHPESRATPRSSSAATSPTSEEVAIVAPIEAPEESRQAPAASSVFEVEPPYAPGERPALPTGLIAKSAAEEALVIWNAGGSSAPEHPSNRPGFHPAVRVVVDAIPLRRLPKKAKKETLLTESRLVAQVRSLGYWPFRVCFEDVLRRNPENPGGETRVRVTVSSSGRISAVRLLRSELEDRTGGACLVNAARALKLSPAPVRRLDVDLLIRVWPGDLPVLGPPATAKLTSSERGQVAVWTASRTPELKRCYEAGLRRDPLLWGRIELFVSVDADGRIQQVREGDTRFPDPEVIACLARELSAADPLAGPRPLHFALALRCGAPKPEAQPLPTVPPAPPSPLGIPPAPLSVEASPPAPL